tara:strand:- start:32 stop:568 length:537 start_codon:yes stop_codon:yes gene_type:complete
MSPRQTAIRNGDKTYEGKPCKEGHTARYAADYSCIRCSNEHSQEYFINMTEDQKEEKKKKDRQYSVEYRRNLKETVEGRKHLAENQLNNRYDITSKDWIRMYEEQNGICANPECDITSHPRWWEQGRGIGFQVDHDHNTEEVRGLLCHECNVLEGVVFKSPKKTMGIIEYRRVWDENK